MKYLLWILLLIAATGCRNNVDTEIKPWAAKMPRQHTTLLMEIVLHVNGGQPADIDDVTFYEAGGRPFIKVQYHYTQTGQSANLLIEGPSVALAEPVAYSCLGGCPCYINGTLNPQGEYMVKCTCTTCLLVIYPYAAANVLFEP